MRIYGPVPSRRFGLSLGVDVLPHKTCSMDCIYCQLGPSESVEITQQEFFALEDIVFDVKQALIRGPKPNVITLAGSGEPTLYSRLGELIDCLHALCDIPILVITNSTMLHIDKTAKAVMKSDILAPSLDAGDEETYWRVNRTHKAISYDLMFEGLRRVTHEFSGEINLEVMLIAGVNDSESSLIAISKQLQHLRFDRIDINTPVRPPVPERGALPCSVDVLLRAQELFGPKAHPIADFRPVAPNSNATGRFSDQDKDIREMLLRRPGTLKDISLGLQLSESQVANSLQRLISAGIVECKNGNNGYYYVSQDNPFPNKAEVQ